ncbi:hypothetical protein F0358_10830 [Empedobacter brevis]|uniref:hypothetical protein n=1 Tax=Empedobacter brevis TaxID=247 RepID=UPI00123D84E4|nr:hypothetical protein [Empedobacter brevis]QES93167.1 hypothetical protein F0358_10830 [Empedobacter brevis]
MELNVVLTKRFKKSLSLCVKEFPNIVKDLKNEFLNKDFNQVFENNYFISDSKTARIIKLRIKNSSAKKGKSGGFRMIYYINNKTKELVFMEIYSKIGKNKINNLNSDEYPKMLKEYILEKDTCEKIVISLIGI